ncbi:lipopolysaccharide heptosyltransferase I [uncultured Ramlibacter sp.]|uniref:lipopolysaccharide heptosyltransferase I n=1 Tax=uncultured Ramlibacter sp. TaxID=260755 RepID=UPI00260A637A|nr:lipopolysaccharide heptosyltransferase I [uncultured Ramlibacter sp.]
MNILIVKLSSLGDVVHTMPAVQDMRAQFPQARIDWVVERSFAGLAQRCQGVDKVIVCDLRGWRKALFAAQTRSEWRAFREDLHSQAYEAVIDLQGLTKSALVSRMARLAPGGKRYALANQTEDSGYEAPTRWVADVAFTFPSRTPVIERSRVMCARALGYAVPEDERFGLVSPVDAASGAIESGASRCVVLVHGTAGDDKRWPDEHWIELGQRLLAGGWTVGLPHGSEEERLRSERIAAALGEGAAVWPRTNLGTVADRLAGCFGVVGVDTGLSHIAVALDLPHVQIYMRNNAWRTEPVGRARQRAVWKPDVDTVWQLWLQVSAAP